MADAADLAGKKRERGSSFVDAPVVSSSLASCIDRGLGVSSSLPFVPRVVPFASPEQLAIVDAVASGKNVMVEAVAGSGKTTTALHVVHRWAKLHPQLRAVIITYSRALMEDTCDRLNSLSELEGVSLGDAQTIHSMMMRVYGEDCRNDEGFKRIIDRRIHPKGSCPTYGLIIIDEAQDITPIRFAILYKFIRDMSVQFNSQIVIMGDREQTVRAFEGADHRFLTLADRLYNAVEGVATAGAAVTVDAVNSPTSVKREWAIRSLSISYRLSPEMCDFLNEAVHSDKTTMDEKKKIMPAPERKRSQPVEYYRGDAFRIATELAVKIVDQITRGLLRAGDIMVLANSTNPSATGRKTPLQAFTERIAVEAAKRAVGPLCHIDILSDKADINCSQSKILVTNFVRSKGLERKVVIIFGFDSGYFQFYARGADPSRCPPQIHVPLTRAKKGLILVGESGKGPGSHPFPFLKLPSWLEPHCSDQRPEKPYVRLIELAPRAPDTRDQIGSESDDSGNEASNDEFIVGYINDLRGTSGQDVIKASRLALNLVMLEAARKGEGITLESTVEMDLPDASKVVESVSAVNGLALPALLEAMRTGSCSIYSSVTRISAIPKNDNSYGQQYTTTEDIRRRARAMMDMNPFRDDAKINAEFIAANIAWFLEISCLYRTSPDYVSPFVQYYSQIASAIQASPRGNWDWIKPPTALSVLNRLEELVPAEENSRYETLLVRKFDAERIGRRNIRGHETIKIKGQIDVISDEALYEIKCINGVFQDEHFLQLALYAWLDVSGESIGRRYFMVNALTMEKWELIKNANLEKVVDMLVSAKFFPALSVDSDEAFMGAVSVAMDPSSSYEDIKRAFERPPAPAADDDAADDS